MRNSSMGRKSHQKYKKTTYITKGKLNYWAKFFWETPDANKIQLSHRQLLFFNIISRIPWKEINCKTYLKKKKKSLTFFPQWWREKIHEERILGSPCKFWLPARQSERKQQTGTASLVSLTDTDLSHIKLTHLKFHKDLADSDRWMKEVLYIFPRYRVLLKSRCEKGYMLPHMYRSDWYSCEIISWQPVGYYAVTYPLAFTNAAGNSRGFFPFVHQEI